MLESKYQSNIIKAIEAIGGVVVNGQFSKAGEADLQCGYPVVDKIARDKAYTQEDKYHLVTLHGSAVLDDIDEEFTTLRHLAIEVKTEKDYYRVMKCINEDYTLNGKKGLKPHEPLQMAKIRRNRKLHGLALVAYSFEQVKAYVEAQVH